MVNLDQRPVEQRLPRGALPALRAGQPRIVTDAGDRIEAVIRLDPTPGPLPLHLAAHGRARARPVARGAKRGQRLSQTLNRSRDLQFRFNAVAARRLAADRRDRRSGSR